MACPPACELVRQECGVKRIDPVVRDQFVHGGQWRIRTTEGFCQLISSRPQLSLPAYAVGGLDFVFIRPGCSPSSLYTFPVGLGSALPSPVGFAEFEECTPTDSSVGLQSSPVSGRENCSHFDHLLPRPTLTVVWFAISWKGITYIRPFVHRTNRRSKSPR